MLIYRFSFVFILLLSGVLAAAQQPLTPTEIASFKEKTTASMKNIQSLQCNFTQTKVLSYLDDAVRSSGTLYFQSPGKIRWEYRTPTPYVVVFNTGRMYTRNKAGQVMETDFSGHKRFSALSDVLSQVTGQGNFFDESRFTTSYYKISNGYRTVLVPREKTLGRYIKQIELSIDATSFLVKQVNITDPSGDYIQLDFTDQRKNVPVADDKFAIK